MWFEKEVKSRRGGWLSKASGFLRRWRRGVAREEEDVEGTREPKDVKGGRRKRMR
jgi:hypothetical protein